MKENGIVRCVRDFIADQLAAAEINSEGRIYTRKKGVLPTPFIIDLWYNYLRNHEGEYSFQITGDVPLQFFKSEIKIRNRK